MNARILITGADGFVGRNLMARLEGAIPLTRQDADLRLELPPLPPVAAIVHCAASIDDPEVMEAVNVEGTRRLRDRALAAGVRTFIYLSTGGTEGPYCASKRRGEDLLLETGGAIDVQVLRLFFPYGPGQGERRLVPRLLRSVREGRAITVRPDGGPILSLTWIGDLVEVIARSLVLRGSHRFDVGGPPVAMCSLAETLGRGVGRAPVFAEGNDEARDLVAGDAELRAARLPVPATPLERTITALIGAGSASRIERRTGA